MNRVMLRKDEIDDYAGRQFVFCPLCGKAGRMVRTPTGLPDREGRSCRACKGSWADHLEWLGIDGIWLNPTFPSPNADWGYDVSDYYGVHPELGTLQDLDGLIADARGRGIAVLLDLVPNHTSDRHPWFRERPDLYVWADGDAPPNNWLSSFGGPAWSRDGETGRWYLHLFAPEQPDLDWWNDAVRDECARSAQSLQ